MLTMLGLTLDCAKTAAPDAFWKLASGMPRPRRQAPSRDGRSRGQRSLRRTTTFPVGETCRT